MAQELAFEPTAYHFVYHQEQSLEATLAAVDKTSTLLPITSVNDVLLDGEGRIGLRQPHRLTSWALFQLCQMVCPGLHGVIMELSGIEREANTAREDYSFEYALRVLNEVIHRRFKTRLCGKMFLRNVKEQTIDGVVTPKYRWLSNLELFNKAQIAMRSLTPAHQFLEASLYGRWVMFRFVSPTPAVKLIGPNNEDDYFYQGFHFSNNEVGKASVRAASILYRKFSKSASLSPAATKMRVRHTGSMFTEKLDDLIAGAISRTKSVSKLQNNLECLRTSKLGVADKNTQTVQRVLDKWVERLAKRKLPATIAKRVLGNIIRQPSYDDAPAAVFHREERTVFDIYNALGRDTKDLPINYREIAEQAAYDILIGNMTIG